MVTTAAANDQTGRMEIDTRRPKAQNNLYDMLRQLALDSGRPLGSMVNEHLKTAFGKGKLTFDEYVALRLYDPKRYARENITQFVGVRAIRPMWWRANYRTDLYDLVQNKIALAAVLEAHGIPTIPLQALFSTVAGFESGKCLRSPEALREFLIARAHYPLFGKPKGGEQSLGAVSLLRYENDTKQLIAQNGRVIPLDEFVNEVAAHYGNGYLFQPRIAPHHKTREICEGGLATVRVLTMLVHGEPQIWRVCEKLPAGANIADNYWRSGNILAALDPSNGTRLSAVTGTGAALRSIDHHPDSGAPIVGTKVPNWDSACRVALEGARVFSDLGVIGWDIAPTEEGALIVEANTSPDPFLPQLADRRGLLDEKFAAFLAERDRMSGEWKRFTTKHSHDLYRPSFWN